MIKAVRNTSNDDPRGAFGKAIAQGRLNDRPTSPLYAGKFMVMGHYSGKDQFKHINTRHYVK